jgi:ElaB/YqjD/DUF883 family membrane-anchored ribosome-binding protein
MSGPKKSSWEIKQEIREQRKREKALKRACQIDDINQRILKIVSEMNKLSNQYPKLIKNIQKNTNEWINEIKAGINGDLRDSFRRVKGIEKYIEKQKTTLQNKQVVLDAKNLIEEKKKMLIESLETVKEEYKDILNDAIIQKVEMFKKSILSNPNNTNTQKQIINFKKQLFNMQEEYLDKVANTKYVANTFADILQSNIKNNGDAFTIKGDIDGVPISVKLNSKNSNIDLDTPLDGSCKKALETMQKKLNNAKINLGEIRVINSGEILNRNINRQSQQRIRA